MNDRRFVIVGAALAGASAAAALREGGFDGRITLIGAEPLMPYNRPPLSKGYLRGQDRFEDQLVNPPAYYAEHRIDLRLGLRADAIDPKRKLVSLDRGEEVPYDRLLVATGGRNRTLTTPGADLPGMFQLRTVEDCDRIRAAASSSAFGTMPMPATTKSQSRTRPFPVRTRSTRPAPSKAATESSRTSSTPFSRWMPASTAPTSGPRTRASGTGWPSTAVTSTPI